MSQMTNLQAVIAILAAHREGRKWTDEAVAADLVAQLGLDPAGDAKNAAPVIDPGITEAEVVAHEQAAQDAVDKAVAARNTLNAQQDEKDSVEAEVKAKADADAKDAVTAKRLANARQVSAENVRQFSPDQAKAAMAQADAASKDKADVAADQAKLDADEAKAAADERDTAPAYVPPAPGFPLYINPAPVVPANPLHPVDPVTSEPRPLLPAAPVPPLA
jgi:hypothetical protein